MIIGKEKAGTSVIRINSTKGVHWHQRKKQNKKQQKILLSQLGKSKKEKSRVSSIPNQITLKFQPTTKKLK
jgi:polysaccharide deacetylase 2 family uncharacterized protein YibQ